VSNSEDCDKSVQAKEQRQHHHSQKSSCLKLEFCASVQVAIKWCTRKKQKDVDRCSMKKCDANAVSNVLLESAHIHT
jgi:hypothetical protein